MRRVEIVATIERIVSALETSGLSDLAKRIREARVERSPSDFLDIFKRFTTESQSFGAAEHELLEIFDLSDLEDTDFWQELIVKGLEPPEVRGTLIGINRFRDYLLRVVRLFQNDAMLARTAAEEHRLANREILTAILLENRGEASRPARIVEAIRSITQLYEVCAILTDAEPDTLSVVGCDSGSDKSFDFLGVSSAIQAIKELIIGLWDRTVFYRQARNDAYLNQALKSLKVVEEIGRLQEEGKIDHEHGERLKHQVLTGATAFINCGMLIPEIREHTSYDPRMLLAPQPRLLTAGVSSTPETPPPAPEPAPTAAPHSQLTTEEEALLRRLLEKARGATGET